MDTWNHVYEKVCPVKVTLDKKRNVNRVEHLRPVHFVSLVNYIHCVGCRKQTGDRRGRLFDKYVRGATFRVKNVFRISWRAKKFFERRQKRSVKWGLIGKWTLSSGKSLSRPSITYLFSNCPREGELAVGINFRLRVGSVGDYWFRRWAAWLFISQGRAVRGLGWCLWRQQMCVLVDERKAVAVAPAGLFGWKALVMSSGVQWALRVSFCHSQCIGDVHLTMRMKWRVKAVGSPAHSLLSTQTVAVGSPGPSWRGLGFATHIRAWVLEGQAPRVWAVKAGCRQHQA